jgi:REP element-mobilizing transposase RayT
LINEDVEERLYPYLGGIARENKMKAIAIGGVADHVHMLLSLPSTLSLAKAEQLLKGGSSLWMHSEFPQIRDFDWQEGYGGFSIGVSQVASTIEYIKNQKAHHKKISFEEEYRSFLKKHGIEFDERYLFG